MTNELTPPIETTKPIPLKPENSHFTDGQWQAVYDSGDNILVSASAGSGKTTVLVQRVIEKIKDNVNIDELLIVTYTEAAAKEMKGRILEAVKKELSQTSDQELKHHLTNQLVLIPTATISTLHAFCLKVIRKYYYLINIDPVFRMLTDETEMILLKEEVWDDLRNKLYEEEQEAFYRLTENFSNDRNDEGLTELIFDLYDFARANPDPKAWLRSLAQGYDASSRFSDIPIYQEVIKPRLLSDLTKMTENSREMLRLAEGAPELSKPLNVLQDEAPLYPMLEELIETDQVEELYNTLQQGVLGTRYPGLRKLEPAEKEVNMAIQTMRKSNKEMLKGWVKGVFSLPPAEMVAIMAESHHLVAYMGEVALLFEEAYTQRKEQLNLLDFNDLEHLTLRILATQTADGWVGTEASTFYRQLFSEVLVDEYQDINQLQESIIFWLRQPTSGAGNLFMVGDVKQSIYAFRLADPTLFIDKYNRFGNQDDGRRIILAENFRSRGEVLDFTNLVFQQLMDSQLGQLDYDEPAQLVTGFQNYPVSDKMIPELLIYESEEDEGEEVEDVTLDFEISHKTEGELRLIGKKIKELFATDFQVFDKKEGKERPLTYSDIVLLSSTKKNNLVLLEIFKELGIPVEVNDTQNYFQATEIKIMVALLKIIDNPYQDIPFAAVLRSPIVGLKENDLAYIRANGQEASFYEGFKRTLSVPEDRYNAHLLEKLITFREQLQRWRQLARRQELVTLIWTIYEETGFLDYVGGMSAGNQRQANLHALYQRAAAYEEMSFRGLFQFVRFIEKMAEKDKDLAEPTDLTEQQDAVRVMSIHGSKGLEFPVVFVWNLTNGFNLQDLNKAYLFDPEFGAGIKYRDLSERLGYKTLPYVGIREQKLNKALSEEMRKLYVALTRAEEKLYLVGSYKNKETALKKWALVAEEEGTVLSTTNRLKGKSLMDWLGMTLIRHRDMANVATDIPVAKVATLASHPGRFHVAFFVARDLGMTVEATPVGDTQKTQVTTTERLSALDQPALDRAKAQLAFLYPHQVATHTASYQSVSEIKRVFEDPDNAELLVLDLSEQAPKMVNRYVAEEGLAKPTFIQEQAQVPTRAEIGTATHLFMQLLPMEKMPTIQSLEKLAAEFVDRKIMSQEVASAINLEQIVAFFETDFGQRLLENQSAVTKEAPFSMLLKATDIYQNYPPDSEDVLLIHGIIDGYLETAEELILYDFKTDYVGQGASLDKIKQRYSGQLHLYRQALSEAKGRAVTGVKLILLASGDIIDM